MVDNRFSLIHPILIEQPRFIRSTRRSQPSQPDPNRPESDFSLQVRPHHISPPSQRRPRAAPASRSPTPHPCRTPTRKRSPAASSSRAARPPPSTSRRRSTRRTRSPPPTPPPTPKPTRKAQRRPPRRAPPREAATSTPSTRRSG